MSMAPIESNLPQFPCHCRRPARGLNRRFRRGKRGRMILARSAIAVEEEDGGTKEEDQGELLVYHTETMRLWSSAASLSGQVPK